MKKTVVSGVSPRVPIHCTTIVVVGSRCQVRNRVWGWNLGNSAPSLLCIASNSASFDVLGAATLSAACPNSTLPDPKVVKDVPRNNRRLAERMLFIPKGADSA